MNIYYHIPKNIGMLSKMWIETEFAGREPEGDFVWVRVPSVYDVVAFDVHYKAP